MKGKQLKINLWPQQLLVDVEVAQTTERGQKRRRVHSLARFKNLEIHFGKSFIDQSTLTTISWAFETVHKLDEIFRSRELRDVCMANI